jgi:lantibiotic leader peptide-processing serine protease
MRSMRRPVIAGVLAASVFAVVQSSSSAGTQPREYVVLYERGVSAAQGNAAVKDAGGRVVSVNKKIGVATVRSANKHFTSDAASERAIVGAAPNTSIGHTPQARPWHPQWGVEFGGAAGKGRTVFGSSKPKDEPLAAEQWDMRMIGATSDGSYRKQPGSHAVRVGILDTGIDASHPDIAPNFDHQLSRNFVTDMPDIDGPCEETTCHDPADVDQGGHGTHVAGTVGAALNGVGIAGVAPKVDLVNIRAGQDSGFFFLQPTVNALTYAGDHGIDVVNMSYFIDPWLYNCANNPADSPAEQQEQRTIVAATQRALDYAHRHGVTLVSALGNEDDDLGAPEPDETSPDFPPGNEKNPPRTIDNATCLSMPTEGNHVIGVSAVGPSKRKSFYSNYGTEQTDVSAPGGDSRDTITPPSTNGRVLSSYPESALKEECVQTPDLCTLNADGTPNTPLVVQSKDDPHVYWRWLQGTSMASPHAVGVAALIVAEYGKRDRHHGGVTLNPDKVEKILRRTATDTPCPNPRLFDYPEPASGDQFTAFCDGPASDNGFYGDGIVNALAAVSSKHGGRGHHGHHRH